MTPYLFVRSSVASSASFVQVLEGNCSEEICKILNNIKDLKSLRDRLKILNDMQRPGKERLRGAQEICPKTER